ncbi:MAG: hypothetical protein ACYDHW_16825, partial [Syntrophorhabdaceae bacterium]
GSYTLTCAVKGADGSDLGNGSGSISVTVSQSDVSTGKKKDEAKKKLDNAKQLWSQKKYEEAIGEAQVASRIDTKLAAPVLSQFSQELKKMGWDALNRADHKEAIKRLEQAVQLNPSDADARKKLEEAKKYGDAWPKVEAKAKEFDGLIAQKKIWSAQKAMLEMQEILSRQSGGQAAKNPLMTRVQADFNKGLAWYNEFSQKSNAEWTRLFKAEDWEKAEVHVKQVLTQELNPSDKKQFEGALQTINSRLATKREAMQYYETAKANFARGVPADAAAVATVVKELKDRGTRLKADDPGRAQLNELAAAMEKKQKTANVKAFVQSAFKKGDDSYRSYNFEAAIARYDEGLKVMRDSADIKDPDYAKYSKLREDAVIKEKRFKELSSYVANLATTAQTLDEATIKKGMASAEEALKIKPRNGDMEIHLNKLKGKLGDLRSANAKKLQASRACEAKWTEGQALYKSGKYTDALTRFKENVACAPGNKERENYIRGLEDSVKEQAAAKQACLTLRQQGDQSVQQKKYAEAVGKYRESLKCQPDPKLEAYIRQLEGEVKKQADAQAAAIYAKQLRSEGEQLQKQNKIREAVAKYKESLKYMPDPALQGHIATLETQVEKQDEQQAAKTRAIALREEGAQFQSRNKVREAVAKYKESLKYMPDPQLEAHIRKLEASLTTKPTGAPPTAVNTSTGPSSSAWSGNWKSVPGPEGETITFDLASSGKSISGNFHVTVLYKTSSGAQKTDTFSGPLQGTISGNKATGTFHEAGTPKNKGSFDFTMVPGHKEFSCTVRGEGGEARTYTVRKTR